MSGKILVRTVAGVLQEFPIESSVRVGSGPGSDLVIEGDGVLPEHARVGVTVQGCWIENVGGSRVAINGERADRKALRHLDVITLGEHVHAIFLSSSLSLPKVSRQANAASATDTVFGVPAPSLFTPPPDDQWAESTNKTVFGIAPGGVFTPPLEDLPAATPLDSPSSRTVAGLPLSALSPPLFDAPPSQTVRILPISPPRFAPGQPLQPIRGARLSGTDGDFELPLGVSVIGRGSKATVRIDSVKISRVHAAVVVSRDQVTIEDQDSANGTSVNGVRLKARHVLADGDLVSFGSMGMRVTFIRQARDEQGE